MSVELMKGALRKGRTGDELLAILNALVGDNGEAIKPIEGVSMAAQYGTLEDIDF